MNEITYVGPEAAQWITTIENRFKQLSSHAGVIFVSVQATPGLRGETNAVTIRLGLAKHLTEAVGRAIINMVMEDEIKSGTLSVSGSVYLGLNGAYSDKSVKDPNPAP